eukprot:350587-Chlamydomonas_euryale.AAC.2
MGKEGAVCDHESGMHTWNMNGQVTLCAGVERGEKVEAKRGSRCGRSQHPMRPHSLLHDVSELLGTDRKEGRGG